MYKTVLVSRISTKRTQQQREQTTKFLHTQYFWYTHPKSIPQNHGISKVNLAITVIIATSAIVGTSVSRKIISHSFLKALASSPKPAKSIIFISAISLQHTRTRINIKVVKKLWMFTSKTPQICRNPWNRPNQHWCRAHRRTTCPTCPAGGGRSPAPQSAVRPRTRRIYAWSAYLVAHNRAAEYKRAPTSR